MRSRVSSIAIACFALSAVSACGSAIETSHEITTGTTSDAPPPPPEDPVSPLPDPGVRLAQGMKPTCLKTAAGKVECWSYAGNPDLTGTVEVTGIDDAALVVQSIEQGCALHATGQVSCWGFNHKGQLGLAIPLYETSEDPVVLPEVDVVKITSGHHVVCGIEPSGQAVCWGGEYYGPLGDPTVVESAAPVDVVGLADAIDITAAFDEVCAVHATGAVACWHDQEAPFEIAGVAHASQVAVGASQACAVVDQGAVVCWREGEAPAALPGLDAVAQVSMNNEYGCARRANGHVTCWSSLPDGAVDEVEIDDAIDITARNNPAGGCAVRSSGDVVCWDEGQAPSPAP